VAQNVVGRNDGAPGGGVRARVAPGGEAHDLSAAAADVRAIAGAWRELVDVGVAVAGAVGAAKAGHVGANGTDLKGRVRVGGEESRGGDAELSAAQHAQACGDLPRDLGHGRGDGADGDNDRGAVRGAADEGNNHVARGGAGPGGSGVGPANGDRVAARRALGQGAGGRKGDVGERSDGAAVGAACFGVARADAVETRDEVGKGRGARPAAAADAALRGRHDARPLVGRARGARAVTIRDGRARRRRRFVVAAACDSVGLNTPHAVAGAAAARWG